MESEIINSLTYNFESVSNQTIVKNSLLLLHKHILQYKQEKQNKLNKEFWNLKEFKLEENYLKQRKSYHLIKTQF